jgi:3-oxoacyl-[acyl-carrier-protein] synthase II
MNPAYIADTAIITGLGNSLGETWQNMHAGKSAIDDVRHFGTENIDFHKASVVRGMRESGTGNMMRELALKVTASIRSIPESTYVIWTGVKGDVDFIETGMKENTPFLPAHYIKLLLDATGSKSSGTAVNAACASSTLGLALAAQLIGTGKEESVLICGADLACRFTFMGFAALKALSKSIALPFDVHRDGLSIGDGAAAILVMGEEALRRHGAKALARISGWGIANDANHITGPARDGCGLILSIRKALGKAGLSPDSVQAYCCHGTGTQYNDSMELTAIESVFGERRFPVFSVKGAIGHTMGAAGAIETALSITCMQEGVILPTAGCGQPEERADGRVCNVVRDFAGDNILKSNSGFGGVNVSIVLESLRDHVL